MNGVFSYLLTALLANALLSVPLAIVAWTLHRRFRHAALVRFVCLVAIVKLFTPPMISIPVEWIGPSAPRAAAVATPLSSSVPAGQLAGGRPQPQPSWRALVAGGLLGLWCAGAAIYAVIVVVNGVRMSRWVRRASPADDGLARLARDVQAQLGLRTAPELKTVDADVSPFLWAVRRPVVVMPARLAGMLNDAQLRTVLAHEMCHLHRGDHRWRWLETAAIAIYWWVPSVWWLASIRRDAEELCCDGAVSRSFADDAREYAKALVEAASNLTCTPVFARGAMRLLSHSNTTLIERRIAMIHDRSGSFLSGRLRVAACAAAALMLPVSVGLAETSGLALPSLEEIIAALDADDAQVFAAVVGPDGQLTPIEGDISDWCKGFAADALQNGEGDVFTHTSTFVVGPDGQLQSLDGDDPASLPQAITDLVNQALAGADGCSFACGGLTSAYMVGPNGEFSHLGGAALPDLPQTIQDLLTQALADPTGSAVVSGVGTYMLHPDGALVHVDGLELDDVTLDWVSDAISKIDLANPDLADID